MFWKKEKSAEKPAKESKSAEKSARKKKTLSLPILRRCARSRGRWYPLSSCLN